MSTDADSPSSPDARASWQRRVEDRDDFVWPPSVEEIDAIQVIVLDAQPADDAPPATPITRSDTMTQSDNMLPTQPARPPRAPQPTRGRVMHGAVRVREAVRGRMRTWRVPQRREIAEVGLAVSSILAIATACLIQVNDWRETRDAENASAAASAAHALAVQQPLAPMAAPAVNASDARDSASAATQVLAAEPATQAPGAEHTRAAVEPISNAATRASVRRDAAARRLARGSRMQARRTPAGIRAALHDTTLARGAELRPVVARERTHRTPARSTATATAAMAVSPPLRLPESYVQPRIVSAHGGRRARGTVVLGVEVRPNGRVGDVDVLSEGVRDDLEQAAVRAVKQWRYRPALRAGVPTSSRVKVIVTFS